MNPWVAIDVDMKSNPKVWALAKNVRGLSGDGPRTHIAIAMGHLVELFGAVAKLRPNGRVNDISDELLEEWAGWGGEHGRFAAAFRESFVIDGVIKGWDERNGKLLSARERERERKAADRARTVRRTIQGQGAETAADCPRNGGATVPDLTRPLSTPPLPPASGGDEVATATDNGTATADRRTPRARGDNPRAVTESELEHIRAVCARYSGPQFTPPEAWTEFSDDERTLIKRKGGLMAIWNDA